MQRHTSDTTLWVVTSIYFGIVTIAVFVVGVVAWAAKHGTLLGDNETATYPNISAAQQQAAANWTDHTFPPSARVLYYHYVGFQDQFVEVKLELPAGDVPALLASGPFKAAKFDTTKNGMSHYSHRPFDTDTVTTFRFAEVNPAPSRYYYILINDDRPDTSTVYLIYSAG